MLAKHCLICCICRCSVIQKLFINKLVIDSQHHSSPACYHIHWFRHCDDDVKRTKNSVWLMSCETFKYIIATIITSTHVTAHYVCFVVCQIATHNLNEKTSVSQSLKFQGPWHTYQKPVLKTVTGKMVPVSVASVMQSGTEFFRYQIPVTDRTCSISCRKLVITWSK